MRELVDEWIAAGDLVILSGAGISTESGIPDYRGPTGAARRNHVPMTHQEFVNDATARHRYWARSFLGWSVFSSARPNPGHVALALLEDRGIVDGVITQNVDGLHQAAGSANVIDLHGRLDRVVCLDCRALCSREDVQRALGEANCGWDGNVTAINPDGDVELHESHVAAFTMVGCESCGGTLKPDVVYFGGSVPPERVAASYELVADSRTLLVLGSSLTVFSGRRFVQRASEQGSRVVIVNQGETKCDDLADVKLDLPLGEFLASVTES